MKALLALYALILIIGYTPISDWLQGLLTDAGGAVEDFCAERGVWL